ncbi:deoxyribose-phosphate aldolase [Puniceicoccus vermicola]|uniref:Deoxyribose-phosphate aldolase n=1 Tax=Puniceicoccus vermicola TaxID=388746 RepID=A0A7X1AY25_9BACT|nr:deoxyribose-phosphate aldolase [Puniceicoccus vermicola]MBC2602110.1 deoxyribose-phosphate aldolase [Puniceicoccus vermicola]
MPFSLSEIAGALDATNLKLDASAADIEALCHDALGHSVATVCVYPTNVPLCRKILGSGDVGIAAVIGFPSGRYSTRSKIVEIDEVSAMGASEVDIVLNYPALIEGQTEALRKEASQLAEACRKVGLVSKFIVETCYLDEAQKLTMLDICEKAGANFIKTSTGFGSAGAQLADIELWAKAKTSSHLKIKASGGIRTREQVEAFLTAGASRIGLSSAKAVLSESSTEGSSGGY